MMTIYSQIIGDRSSCGSGSSAAPLDGGAVTALTRGGVPPPGDSKAAAGSPTPRKTPPPGPATVLGRAAVERGRARELPERPGRAAWGVAVLLLAVLLLATVLPPPLPTFPPVPQTTHPRS